MKIHSGDTVKIISGKSRGKTGKVRRALPKKGKVIVSGVNIVKRHLRPSREYPEGGIIEKPLPIDISNVMLVCPKCGQPTRVGYKIEGDKKFRVCKKCGAVIQQ